MHRIIDGNLYEGNRQANAWVVSTWEAAGHRERSVRPWVAWEDKGPAPAWMLHPVDEVDPVRDAEWLAEKAAASQLKGAKRAQTMCRRIIKSEGFNELLTITYRDNQTDRELAKKHLHEWVRRMRNALGGEFRYVASFERQERGAMHMHVACHKLPRHATRKGVKIEGWRLGTEIWRSVVGADNGLVFVGGRRESVRSRKSLRSPAKMAAYVSKYIMKSHADVPEETNRYSRSNSMDVPRPHRLLMGGELADVIGAAFECGEGEVVVSHRVGHCLDSYWLVTESRPPDKKKPA